jgi:glycosyltransferase involved in cell wall biosynthesis
LHPPLFAPSRSKTGGGTRLKILEAWAAGVPVVSTRIGAAGLAGSEDGFHLLLADAPEPFADACVRILTQPDLGRRIATNGRQLVEERYNWTGISEQVIHLLSALSGRRPSRAKHHGSFGRHR